jgi:hypothetical protein
MTQTLEETASFAPEGPIQMKPLEPEQAATTIILLPKTYIAKSAITKAEGYFLIVGFRGQACAVEIDAKALAWLVNDVASSPIIAAKKAVLALAATEKDLNSRGLSIFSVHRILSVDA